MLTRHLKDGKLVARLGHTLGMELEGCKELMASSETRNHTTKTDLPTLVARTAMMRQEKAKSMYGCASHLAVSLGSVFANKTAETSVSETPRHERIDGAQSSFIQSSVSSFD